MIATIKRTFEAILRERSLDWRTCYTDVAARPPDGRTVVCQCSDRSVLDDLRTRLARAGGSGAVGRVEFVALPPTPGRADVPAGMIAAVSVADVRRAPTHASELVSQIVFGDPVEPLKREGEWYLTRLDDGYIGWVHRWHLFELSPEEQSRYRDRAAHRVAANVALVLEAPEPDALPVTDLVVGTRLEANACGRRGWRAVRLPDGREGFTAARSLEREPRPGRLSRERLASTGLRFLGIPYLWGGTTPKGFDCSGLVQRVYRLNGVVIPRDSDQQARHGAPKPAKAGGGDASGPPPGRADSAGAAREPATGDLIFFGKAAAAITHVAMALGEGQFLHAHGRVRVGSLDPRSRLFDRDLAATLQLARDIVSVSK